MAVKKKAARPKTKAKPEVKAAAKRKPSAMSEEAMMAQWQAAMTPGANHARLTPMVGTWRATTTFTMAPGAPPQVHAGTSVNRFVLGGRYLEQNYKGSSMGMPFEGIGYTGYDNVQKRYVGTWMDTMGTGLMNSVGVGHPTDERIDSVAEATEPSGQKKVFETIVRIKNHAHHSYEMWAKGPNGKNYRVMLAEYERG
jgi:hypothetical protein